MKKLLLALSFLFLNFIGSAQIINFTDPGFKAKLLAQNGQIIDTNGDGEIQIAEASVVTSISLIGVSAIDPVNNLSGLEYFTSLVNFDARFQSLAQAVFPSLPNLQTLHIEGSLMTSLDLSNLPALQTVNCNGSYSLVNINLNNLPALQTFNCNNCYSLTSLNLTGITNLQLLNCSYCNILPSITFDGLTNVKALNCSNCQNINLSNINVLSGLENLDCSNCNSALNVTNIASLKVLNVTNNYLFTLDLSGTTNLISLYCSNNNLYTLNLTGFHSLQNLYCNFNGLTTLDVSDLTSLQTLNCSSNTSGPGNGIATITNLANLTNLTYLNCSGNNLTALDISNLVNLTTLICGHNHITSLPISNLTNLTNLNCNYNLLTILDLTPLTNLLSLDFSSNQIALINFSTVLNLTSLDCSSNPLNQINVLPLVHLTSLGCNGNNLTILDVHTLVDLTYFSCGYNQLTTIDMSALLKLDSVNVSGNLITTLDFSHTQVYSANQIISHSYNFSYCPNLVDVNLKNGFSYKSVNASHSTNLVFICTDENTISSILMNLSLDNMNNVQVNSYCSFVPGGTYNTITGNLLLDIQNNGCDASDILMKNTKVVLNDGINTGAAFTNDTANYTFFTQTGGFTLVPQFENNYFNVLPNPGTVNFTDTNSNIQNLSFCATPNGIHNDVEVTLVPLMTLRPGYDSPFRIVYKNKGNQSLSGTININFDDSILDFVSANPATVSQVLNNLNWNYINLLPFETRTIDFTLNLNTPTETPPVNSGDIINFTTSITPVANDETPNDNVFNSSELVLNSFDPNDKSCLEGNAIAPEKVGDYLHYVIRFQNTGSTSAQNIVVKDLIDTTKFDINTLQLTNSSHTNTARITGNKVEFIFENINLPAEIDNEAGSHGFVAFKIKTKNTLVLGNNVQNTANIYFDYNFPIVTNTTSTTVAVLNVKDFDDNSVSITPIPVKEVLQIKALETITSVQLFDIQGRLLQVKMADDTTATLDFDGKSNGVYLVKVYTAKGMKVQKVIKE